VRNYVAEMANNLWATKYPPFDELADAERKRYWSTILTSYQAMYASASQPVACEEGEERAEQLVAGSVRRGGYARDPTMREWSGIGRRGYHQGAMSHHRMPRLLTESSESCWGKRIRSSRRSRRRCRR